MYKKISLIVSATIMLSFSVGICSAETLWSEDFEGFAVIDRPTGANDLYSQDANWTGAEVNPFVGALDYLTYAGVENPASAEGWMPTADLDAGDEALTVCIFAGDANLATNTATYDLSAVIPIIKPKTKVPPPKNHQKTLFLNNSRFPKSRIKQPSCLFPKQFWFCNSKINFPAVY